MEMNNDELREQAQTPPLQAYDPAAGRRVSPYADSPYVSYYEQNGQEPPAVPEKPRKAKKTKKTKADAAVDAENAPQEAENKSDADEIKAEDEKDGTDENGEV